MTMVESVYNCDEYLSLIHASKKMKNKIIEFFLIDILLPYIVNERK